MALSSTPDLLTAFREAYTAFAGVSDALVTKYIDMAASRLDTDAWGAMADETVLLWVADVLVQTGRGDTAEVAIAEAREQGISSVNMGGAVVSLKSEGGTGGTGGVFGNNRYGRRLSKLARLAFAGPRSVAQTTSAGSFGGLPIFGGSLLVDDDGDVFVDDGGNAIVVPS